MSGPIAPCGHPGEAIFGNFVLCRICDGPKAKPAVPVLPVEFLTLVIYDGDMPARCEDYDHRSCELLRTQLQGSASNGRGAYTASAPVTWPGTASYFRVEDQTGDVTFQGTIGTVQRPGSNALILDTTVLAVGLHVRVTLAVTLDPPAPPVYGPFRVSSSGSLSCGLMANVDYWSDCTPPQLDRLANSPANARNGYFVVLTTPGVGVTNVTGVVKI